MTLLGFYKLTKSKTLRRIVFLFFVVFTLADLAYPQDCCVKSLTILVAQAEVVQAQSVTDLISQSLKAKGQSSDQPDSQTDEGHCLCCCSHLFFCSAFSLHVSLPESSPILSLPATFTDSAPLRCYRPPRSA